MKTNRTVGGVDTAKRVFQLHWVDMETGEIVDLRLKRAKFLEHFANRAPCLVAMEACGGSQHWARRIRDLGHEVRLLPAKMVRPFVGGNKNDAHDARAIWTAVQQSWPTGGITASTSIASRSGKRASGRRSRACAKCALARARSA